MAEDRWPFKTAIPPLLQYPVSDRAFDFVSSLVWMFYAPGWAGECWGSVCAAWCADCYFVFAAPCLKLCLPSPACPPAPAGNVKGLFGLLACFLPGGGGGKAGGAAANDKKAL